jgi:DNA-binding beta-propeller fold protein YncE
MSRGNGGEATEVDLSSPWDLALKPGILIVAVAGSHQIWVIDLVNGQAYPYAGSGLEARQDGTAREAAFAQPSGLALDGNTLYVADAESNVIRALALPPENDVTTLAGGDLFDFGDADGTGETARFQHPLGVAVEEGLVYVADTYNHRIRVLDPTTGRVGTVAGTGAPGLVDGRASRAQFFEPGGIAAAEGRLFVADTNNHAVRVITLATGEVRTLSLGGLAPPAAWSYLRK